MKKSFLVNFSVNRPKTVLGLTLAITAAMMIPFPKVKLDTNPKNMLPPDAEVRVWNAEVEKTFGLYEDLMVVGVTNPEGVMNNATLGNIAQLTEGIQKIPGVATSEVSSLVNVDDVSANGSSLEVKPIVSGLPLTQKDLESIGASAKANPLLAEKLLSKDGKTTAIYIPMEKGANGKVIAESIKAMIAKLPDAGRSNDKFYVTGDPVARDTFGDFMFKLMAVFSPVSCFLMIAVMYLMFRSIPLCICMMAVSNIAIIWSVGLVIALGFPIHLMGSMAPVFLMAIATDSIHIFTEFYFRYSETGDRKRAILETMSAVSHPVKYTALTTAVAFSVLLFMKIIPVQVFGGMIAFGTIALRVLSFSFIPAIMALLSEKSLAKVAAKSKASAGKPAAFLRGLAMAGTGKPGLIVSIGLALCVLAVVGISRVVVNNNMVEWFSKKNEVRIADMALNKSLGGTSLGYMVAIADPDHAEYMKTPEGLRFLAGLQRRLEKIPEVGKTSSLADIASRINLVLHHNDPAYADIPKTAAEAGQFLFLFSMSAKPSDVKNLVDDSYEKANVWIQMKTWDAKAMRSVIRESQAYLKENPAPLQLKPAGIAYFNLVWNDEVLLDMLKGFVLAISIVYTILVFNFRSFKWALISYVPLLFTILLILGVVGFIGKDFDMPISVLSCLSLGMAVDFAIHFINRFRQKMNDMGYTGTAAEVQECLLWTASRPGRGILRNAILFGTAFPVMMLSPLTPYITVGAFIPSMMILSAFLTLLYLPALIVLLRTWLFKGVAGKTPAKMAKVEPYTVPNFKMGLLALAALTAVSLRAAENPLAIVKAYQNSFYYQGSTFRGKLKLSLIDADGKARTKEMTMVRATTVSGADQRYFMYFHSPGDVKGMAFLVFKYPNKESDRWLFIPSVDMVQRIAARDAGSSFVGSDFSYQDISGRSIEADDFSYLKDDTAGGRQCDVIASIPKATAGYSKKVSWLDKKTSLPIKEEYTDIQGNVFKRFTADSIAELSGHPIVLKGTMTNLKSNHVSRFEFSDVAYDFKANGDEFTERALRNPPRGWVN